MNNAQNDTFEHQAFIVADRSTDQADRPLCKLEKDGVYYGAKTWMRYIAKRRANRYRALLEETRKCTHIVLFEATPNDPNPVELKRG